MHYWLLSGRHGASIRALGVVDSHANRIARAVAVIRAFLRKIRVKLQPDLPPVASQHTPGGVINPDKLRLDPKAIALVRDFVAAGKPVASICHGPWLLVEADVLRGRRTTAWYSIRTDLKNAGATVVDEEVVVDGNIITSRMPSDIPAFSRAIVAALQN